MFVQLIANLLCMTDWTSGLVGWESFIKLLCLLPILSMHHAGRGSFNFTVTEFDDYYVALGNLNVHEMKVGGSTAYSFRIQVYMRVHSFDLLCNVAYKSQLRCWLTEERHTCWLGYFFRTRETQICT
jgi:hypothetical protein